MTPLAVGITHEMTVPVTTERTAKHLDFEGASVFSTPSMVWLIEHAAQVLAQMHLPPGQTTVGAEIFVRHLAPTPLGMNVTVRVRIEAIDGRRITFSAGVFDETEKIGEGRHVRVIIDHGRFIKKARGKIRTPHPPPPFPVPTVKSPPSAIPAPMERKEMESGRRRGKRG
jgi:fluoroacetyl-CoA thioesterase